MNTPEIASPEFAETPAVYLDGDAVPDTVTELLRLYCRDNAAIYRETAAVYAEWCAQNRDRPSGALISDQGRDQPTLGKITVPLRGQTMTMASPLHSLWLLQRTLDWYRGLELQDRIAVADFAATCGADNLLALDIARPLIRVNNRLAVG
jgi:hypothetical protein